MEKIIKVDEVTYVLDQEKSIIVTFKLDEDILTAIDDITYKQGYSCRSDFIREALEEYLKFLKTRGSINKLL
ncbi:ribbon-helix-helix domain-containing protein [Saccharolobus caldissimus]|uniref:CopG family transcriptional regulator n=1 Tax=Saccharolobus caldissimus TaxID=1702097 RepID=A0AAQ4CT20_9CREN|nr:ribbon-helix-helix domain-containing protein [Saccharolobus caldissimus]BDB98951.1 CopG family transcriptional regulator [Saccharolobus caldissimus]